jgi:hypothetical protein
VLNLKKLDANTLYQIKVAKIKNPTNQNILTAEMGLRIFEEEVDTGIRTQRYYETYRLSFDWFTGAVTMPFDV